MAIELSKCRESFSLPLYFEKSSPCQKSYDAAAWSPVSGNTYRDKHHIGPEKCVALHCTPETECLFSLARMLGYGSGHGTWGESP